LTSTSKPLEEDFSSVKGLEWGGRAKERAAKDTSKGAVL
jgi:hypothetical protein